MPESSLSPAIAAGDVPSSAADQYRRSAGAATASVSAGVADLLNTAHLLRAERRLAEAILCYETVLRVDADCIAGYLGLADALACGGHPVVAVDCYFQALGREPGNVVARTNLASIFREAGRAQEAVDLLSPIAELADSPPTVRFNLANTLSDLGRFEDARRNYAAILPAHPQPAKVLFNLTRTMKFRAEDRPQLAVWRSQAEQRLTTVEDQIYFQFALGKAHDDLGDFDTAWKHFTRGNSLTGIEFDPVRQVALAERIVEVFDPEFLADRAGWGHSSRAPVLIVGMPRSGTSLVEQILGAHPRVQACGEREDLGRLVADWALAHAWDADDPAAARALTAADALRMAEEYLRHVRVEPDGRVTDKMPANFLLLGWVAVCLPEARIIECRRDPRDTCLSCYFQHFTRRLPFAYALDHLVAYHQSCDRLMAHWRRVLADRILSVDYEELVEAPERVGHRLVEFIGLEWDPGCLRSHEHERTVTTASHWQVRQPVYRTSRRRWANYSRHIEPLLRAFGNE